MRAIVLVLHNDDTEQGKQRTSSGGRDAAARNIVPGRWPDEGYARRSDSLARIGFYLRPLDNRHARPRMTGSDNCNQADFDQISNMAQPVITLFCCRMQLHWLKEYHD
jgi:hypothetical protein